MGSEMCIRDRRLDGMGRKLWYGNVSIIHGSHGGTLSDSDIDGRVCWSDVSAFGIDYEEVSCGGTV